MKKFFIKNLIYQLIYVALIFLWEILGITESEFGIPYLFLVYFPFVVFGFPLIFGIYFGYQAEKIKLSMFKVFLVSIINFAIDFTVYFIIYGSRIFGIYFDVSFAPAFGYAFILFLTWCIVRKIKLKKHKQQEK